MLDTFVAALAELPGALLVIAGLFVGGAAFSSRPRTLRQRVAAGAAGTGLVLAGLVLLAIVGGMR